MHRRALSHRKWAEIEEELLALVVDPSRESVDAGANVGSYAVRLAACSQIVHAFEPYAPLAKFLARAAYPNIRVTAAALSRTAAAATLYIPVGARGARATLASMDSATIANPGDMRACSIATEKLDQLRERNIGFIKIDVEGHELAVLEGGIELLKRQRPLVLVEIEERHKPGALAAVQDFFSVLEYVGFFVLGDRTHPLTAFRLEMQDPRELSRPVARTQMAYVNNFFFAPSAITAAKARSAIDHMLAKRALLM